jgi:biopolymer transport protein ExbB
MDMSPAALWNSMGLVGKSVVILMVLMSIYSLWVMVERFVVFQKAKNQSLKLLGALSNLLTKADYSQAIEVTKKYKDSHLAKVIAAGLLEFEASRRDKRTTDPELAVEAARQGMDRTAMITVAELKENLGVLATIGATAPFVGLFGTVVGIMKAMGGFRADEEVKFTTVSGPISEALIVTAVGIFVAVGAVILFNYFSQRASRIATEMKLLTDEFLELLLDTPNETKRPKGDGDGDR